MNCKRRPRTGPVGARAGYGDCTGRAACLWRTHGTRGATYLFLRWCTDAEGPALLSRLSRSSLQGGHGCACTTDASAEGAVIVSGGMTRGADSCPGVGAAAAPTCGDVSGTAVGQALHAVGK